jgi:hypothetical protein
MTLRSVPRLRERTIDQLSIRDERSFRRVELYGDLKEVLRRSGYLFRILPEGPERWDRALLLNLTFWNAAGGDVLEGQRIAADVLTHAAWHHLAALALGPARGARPSMEALFLGESIASAFDIYLVGRLLAQTPRSSFLETQVPALADAAGEAGLSKGAFRRLLHDIASDPERAFADLRSLLFDVTLALFGCKGADEAHAVLVRVEGHRFAPFLHHYEISNWVLYARAMTVARRRPDRRAQTVDMTLRNGRMPLGWLASHWIAPALALSR